MPQFPDDFKKKEALSQGIADFDESLLEKQGLAYRKVGLEISLVVSAVDAPKPFHIGLKLPATFRNEWLEMKYSLAMQYKVEISVQKYVEFLHQQALENRQDKAWLEALVRFAKTKAR